MKIESTIGKIGKKKMRLVEFCRRMDALGISRNTAVKIWQNNTNVMLSHFLAACQVLGVALDDVLTVK